MVTRLMESSPSSRIMFYLESGASIESPLEGRRCGIALDIPKHLWSSISLKVGTVPLPLRLEEAVLCAHSEWPPCAPGHYELSLVCGDIRECRTITVMPQNEPTIDREFFSLHRAIRGTKERLGILQILPIIQRDCHQIFLPQHEIREANKLRRPDISKLPQAISMPGNISSRGTLNRMFDVTVKRSYETYENRLVKAYIHILQSQMSRLQARLQSEPLPALVRDFEALNSEFRLACARATFLREVRLPFTSAEGVTMVLLKNPAYRTVFEDYLALRKQSSSFILVQQQ